MGVKQKSYMVEARAGRRSSVPVRFGSGCVINSGFLDVAGVRQLTGKYLVNNQVMSRLLAHLHHRLK